MRPVLPALAALTILTACAGYRDADVSMATVDINPELYAGTWQEIARFPNPFQRGCVSSTANYGFIDATRLRVLNTCQTNDPNDAEREIYGTADVVGPGQLEIRFSGVPVAAPYWVLWVDDTYETAVVGVPSGRAGWILARSTEVSPEKLADAIAVFRDNGYDTSQLIYDASLAQVAAASPETAAAE
ncbi:MAG: lipocalin family protein [Pseudomonadota bacterium]